MAAKIGTSSSLRCCRALAAGLARAADFFAALAVFAVLSGADLRAGVFLRDVVMSGFKCNEARAHARAGVGRGSVHRWFRQRSPVSCRAITSRWISLVP